MPLWLLLIIRPRPLLLAFTSTSHQGATSPQTPSSISLVWINTLWLKSVRHPPAVQHLVAPSIDAPDWRISATCWFSWWTNFQYSHISNGWTFYILQMFWNSSKHLWCIRALLQCKVPSAGLWSDLSFHSSVRFHLIQPFIPTSLLLARKLSISCLSLKFSQFISKSFPGPSSVLQSIFFFLRC